MKKISIKHIIFDLGDVLLDLDFDRVNRAFQDLLGSDFDRLSQAEETKAIFLKLETGYFSEESFINALQRQAAKVPDGRAMINAWNSLLVAIPPQRLEMLTKLKEKGFDLYLLSNTNSIHIHWLRKYLKNTYQIEDFDERFFKKSYYSHLLKMRKPDAEIFRFVLNDAFIKAEETLFIDDSEANVLAAQELGINVIHHNSGKDITEVMADYF